ncbi:MAG: DDE-type integrase/transposase/recombinase [Hydrogenimonas sp.]|nr:DDE-type integrase/transposase/recombinase [Hydrogenimonas sp.]
MISKEEFVMIHTLKSRGYSIHAIAKAMGLDRRTVAKRLKEKELKSYRKRHYASILDRYKPYIDRRIEQALPDKLPATVICEEIRAQGYKGSLRVVQRYIRSLLPKPQSEPIVRFETDPGYQAQADWTVLRGGKQPLYAFVMVLGCSRMAFVYCSDNMRQATWQMCHEKAFDYFGGIPERIVTKWRTGRDSNPRYP